MSHKPTYLGLLNAIAVGEAFGYELFTAWAGACRDPSLKQILERVAVREAEHAAVFTKRIFEMGYRLRGRKKRRKSQGGRAALTLARSSSSDRKKFKKLLGIGTSGTSGAGEEADDRYSGLFDDTSIDPTTGTLLGRYIAEERDSRRLLEQAFRDLGRHKA